MAVAVVPDVATAQDPAFGAAGQKVVFGDVGFELDFGADQQDELQTDWALGVAPGVLYFFARNLAVGLAVRGTYADYAAAAYAYTALLREHAFQRLDQLLVREPSYLFGLFLQCKHAIPSVFRFIRVARGFSSSLELACGANRMRETSRGLDDEYAGDSNARCARRGSNAGAGCMQPRDALKSSSAFFACDAFLLLRFGFDDSRQLVPELKIPQFFWRLVSGVIQDADGNGGHWGGQRSFS